MSKFFKAIGAFFVGIFNAAKKAFLELTPEQQEAIKSGSGLIDVINDNLDLAPAQIREKIIAKFPGLDLGKLESALFGLAEMFNLTKADNMDDVIDAIQVKLKSLDGAKWASVSQAYAQAMSILFAPKGTKLAQVILTIEWVYQKFFKKSID